MSLLKKDIWFNTQSFVCYITAIYWERTKNTTTYPQLSQRLSSRRLSKSISPFSPGEVKM